MSGAMGLAAAIAALVAEKRAVGCKYDAGERILARFEAFCQQEFPGLGTVTRESAEAWLTAGRERGVRPATLQGLAAPVRELARWLGRRGTAAYVLLADPDPRGVVRAGSSGLADAARGPQLADADGSLEHPGRVMPGIFGVLERGDQRGPGCLRLA